MDDFYVILPSNACPIVHPENSASKYSVSWDNPVNFEDFSQWKVALTELNFNHVSKSVNSGYGIRYHMDRDEMYHFTFNLNIRRKGTSTIYYPVPIIPGSHPPFDSWDPLHLTCKDNRIRIISKFKTELEFPSITDANVCGFSTKVVSSKEIANSLHEMMSDMDFVVKEDILDFTVHSIVGDYRSIHFVDVQTFHFDRDFYWSNPKEMMVAIHKELPIVFKNVVYDQIKDRISFEMEYNILGIRFLKGLNFVLGFEDDFYNNVGKNNVGKTIVGVGVVPGDHPPQVNRGINNMYIYASICQPIQVGDSTVPLLKSVWIDNNKRLYKFGEVQSISINNPMYVPICSSSINSVEINIRSDSGKLVPFIQGAVTSLTLHFKKYG